MDYEIRLGREHTRIDDVWALLRESYWSPGVRREVTEEAVRNSLCVGAFLRAADRQVGFARAVTDYATFAWLSDVVVHPEHRRHGLSKQMIETLFDHPQLRTLRRWCLATRDAHDLYARYGFKPVDPGFFMERKNDPTVWQATPTAPPRHPPESTR